MTHRLYNTRINDHVVEDGSGHYRLTCRTCINDPEHFTKATLVKWDYLHGVRWEKLKTEFLEQHNHEGVAHGLETT